MKDNTPNPYESGWIAGRKGESRYAPHELDGKIALHWIKGYRDARRAKRNVRRIQRLIDSGHLG